MTREAIHYGYTPTGKKIHLGEHVNWTDKNGTSCVDAFCGALMDSRLLERGNRPLPAKVKEYCKRCFATDAWAVFEETMLKESR